ncbi:MAG: YhcN/YlaJ family sporulation lipoprotein [Bacillota bacterium]
MNSPDRKPRPQSDQIQAQAKIDPELSEKVKEAAKTVKGVEDSTAVVIGNNISMAVKVKGFDRLRLKSIRQDVRRKVKELAKDYKVNVTADKKIFSQIQQIEKKIREQKVQSPESIKPQMEKINKSMHG